MPLQGPYKEKRTFEKGVDMDSALIGIEQGFSRYMLNCLIDEGVNVTNIKGNLLAEFEDGFTFFKDNPDYDYRCIGSKYDPIYRKTYFFVVASDGAVDPTYYSFIFEYDVVTGIVNVVCDEDWSDVLAFDFNELITGISVEFINTDIPLLYWTQKSGLRKINIYKAKNIFQPGGYQDRSLQIVELIKYPPAFPPTIDQITDPSYRLNNIVGKYFDFAYIYGYDDLEESVPSEYSKVNIPKDYTFGASVDLASYLTVTTLFDVFQSNNCIKIILNTGYETVKKLYLLFRQKTSTEQVEVNGDWYIYDSIDKEELSLGNNVDYEYSFYNDKAARLILQSKAVAVASNVPLSAVARENGEQRRHFVANVTEGFNLEPIDVSVEFVADDPPYNYVVQEDIYVYKFQTGAVGNIGTVTLPATVSYIKVGGKIMFSFSGDDGVAAFSDIYVYVVKEGDLDNYPTSLVTAIGIDFNIFNKRTSSTFTLGDDTFTFYILSTYPITPGNNQIVAAVYQEKDYTFRQFKNRHKHYFGISYRDFGGRKSSVQEILPVYADEDVFKQLKANITINHVPPIWAYYYDIVYLGIDCSEYYQLGATSLTVTATGFTIDTSAESTNPTLHYEFVEGDRMIFLWSDNGGQMTKTIDVPILSMDNATGVATLGINKELSAYGSSDSFIVEVYRPDTTKTIYRTIETFAVGDPGLSTRYHEGNIQNQSYSPDLPSITQVESPESYITLRYWDLFSPQFAEDRNQTYANIVTETNGDLPSAVTSYGKPNIINDNFKQVTRENTIWFSEQFIPESNINGLSSFPDGQFKDYQSFGSIQKLHSTDRALKVFMELRCGWIPIGQEVSASGADQAFTLNTTNVLTPMIYYEAFRGIGKHPESHAYFGTSDYFLDPITGAICRISRDGLTVISDIKNQQGNYLVRQSLYDAIKNHDGNFVAGFNERRNAYEVNIGGIVMVWDEQKNSWMGGRTYDAECFGNAGIDLVSFYNGRLYLHEANELRNNFYGVQYTSKLWVPGNWQDFKKIYKAICERSETPWYAYEILNDVGQKSIIDKIRFVQREGLWYAAFRRDMNTVNVVNPIVDGKQMRDTVILLKLENNSVEHEWLNYIVINQIESK